jgi:predicted transcriptional regulator
MSRLGELEHAVMLLLWSSEDGLTAREITDQLPSRPALTTVLTVLHRLAGKGMTTRTGSRPHRHVAVCSRDALAADTMRAALDSAGDDAAALIAFVRSVTPEQAAALRAALREHDRQR